VLPPKTQNRIPGWTSALQAGLARFAFLLGDDSEQLLTDQP
jgi:hypothetical protein